MKMDIKLGAIILSYKNINDTIECINSLRSVKSELANIEIFLVDNSDSDDYLNSIIKSTIVEHSYRIENRGYADGNNYGIKKAIEYGCRYILVINNDTVVDPNFLDPLISELRNDKIAMVAPKILTYKDHKVWSSGGKYRKALCDFAMLYDDFTGKRKAVFITGCCFLTRSELFNDIGLLQDKYFMYVEDAEFSNRIRKRGMENLVIADSIIYHKVSNSSGIESPFQLYYLHRNRMAFANEEYRGLFRIYAVGINVIKTIYWICKKTIAKDEKGVRALWHALLDFNCHSGRYRY